MSDRRIESVIWDFNGTILDDLDLVLRSVNPQLERQGLPPMTREEYRDVFGFPVQDYYRRLGFDFEKVSMTKLADDFFALYEPELGSCPLHSGVAEALDALRKNGMRQFVLSAMEQGMLRRTLGGLGILEYFTAAYGLSHQEADSKISRGRELLSDFDIDPPEALMVGDTDHDAEVAAALGMSSVLVTTGHQSAERLRATGHPVLGSSAELPAFAGGPTGR